MTLGEFCELSGVPISVVVPTRNAASMIEACLRAIRDNQPAEIIVVDGNSEDTTVTRARPLADLVLSDGGRGVAYARQFGVERAGSPLIALVDADVTLSEGALSTLRRELEQRGLDAIQARLRSIADGDYWSTALAAHHNSGRSKSWFGLSATLFRRDVLLRHKLDAGFRSGEDIELRFRLRREGVRVGASESVTVVHYFPRGFSFALNQWLSDGAGLGRLVRKYGWRSSWVMFLPLGGALLALPRVAGKQFRFIPYYVMYVVFNYVGVLQGLRDSGVGPAKGSDDGSL